MLYRLWLFVLQSLGFDPRGIFRYYDGKRYRHADPMLLLRALWSVEVDYREFPDKPIYEPFESDKVRELIKSGNGLKLQRGYQVVAEAVRQVFDVDDLEHGGLTEVECDDLLARFEHYVGDLKKNGNGWQTSRPSTDSTDESPTNSGSDSTSTHSESTFDLPDVSGLALQ